MDDVTLTPDLELFVSQAVASGRFKDPNELLRAGVELVREQERARQALTDSVLSAQAEGDRDGFLGGGDLLQRIEDRLAKAAAPIG